jgi:hypothetical protein
VRRFGYLAVPFAALLLLVSSSAAATRYAAPGGTGADPCTNPAAPCSIYTAADPSAPGTTVQTGDEVVLAPGEYSDVAGDLGPSEFVQLAPGIEVRGETGKPRPKIVLEHGISLRGALLVEANDVVSHLEIATSVARTDIEANGGIVEDLIARNTSTASQSIACVQVAGTIRNSACLSSAPSSAAVGESSATPITSTATLRNVTAVDTGAGGEGLSYSIFGTGGVTVSAKSVIAKGDATDVAAAAIGSPEHQSGTGGHVTITLDHSDYLSAVATSDTLAGAVASITNPGTNGNIEAAPLLAADGYHEVAGSPTIDTGETDGESATTDIDGQSRAIEAPDIGADEYAHPTSLTLSCTPAEVILTDAVPGGGTTCRATVTDEAENPLAFSGSVSFSSSGAGSFEAHSCQLPPSPEPSVTCQVNYLPRVGSAGSHTITAAFAGDAEHEGSQATASVEVTEMMSGPCTASSGSCGGESGPKALSATIARKPSKKSTSRVAMFTFTSSEQASFECKLDKQKFKSCHSPYKHKVKLGHHSFAVRAVGATGLTSSPVTYGWRVLRPARR